jgi:putative ABC transport system permease protein
MHFLPILSTLRRHRTAATLIVLQIALTCAIVCNAVFLIRERLARMDLPSGIAEDEIVRIQLTGIGSDADANALTAEDLRAFAAIPGVKHAAVTNMMPFGGSSWNNSVSTKPEDPESPVNAAMWMGSEDLLETFGVRIVAGRDFTPEEYVEYDDVRAERAKIASVIITKGVADTLFPGENAVGKQLYTWGDTPTTVVGVVEHIARPNDVRGPKGVRWSMFYPVRIPFTVGYNYVLRTDPSRRQEVLAAAVAAIDKIAPNRIVLDKQSFGDVRKDHFKQDRAMAWLLVGVCIALLVITALGIVGLASFWVQQRTRQIGVRRALGATRGQILQYFQTENFILATIGIVLGMGLAYAINLWLMDKYGVARLPAEFLPFGALLLWFLGQVAVLGPALRASAVPPAVATRTV